MAKKAADTKAVNKTIAEAKKADTPVAEKAPSKPTEVVKPELDAVFEGKNEAAKENPVNAPTIKANEAAKEKDAERVPNLDTEKSFKTQLAEEAYQADINEQINSREREEMYKKAAEEVQDDAEARTEALKASMSGEGGKLTEPNFFSEAEHHNALSAINTARINEPDYVDAARRGSGDGVVEELVNTQEHRKSPVGEGVDHELTDPERNRVELLRSRAEMRDVDDPKNKPDEEGFKATLKQEDKEMSAHQKEVDKAEKETEAHQKKMDDEREKAQKAAADADAETRKRTDAEIDRLRSGRLTAADKRAQEKRIKSDAAAVAGKG